MYICVEEGTPLVRSGPLSTTIAFCLSVSCSATEVKDGIPAMLGCCNLPAFQFERSPVEPGRCGIKRGGFDSPCDWSIEALNRSSPSALSSGGGGVCPDERYLPPLKELGRTNWLFTLVYLLPTEKELFRTLLKYNEVRSKNITSRGDVTNLAYLVTHLYYLSHRLHSYSLPLTMPVQFLAPQLHFIDQVFGLSNA